MSKAPRLSWKRNSKSTAPTTTGATSGTMPESTNVNTVLNVILAGTSGLALNYIPPMEYPYAFTACALGLCHGLLGLADSFKLDDSTEKVKEVTTSILELCQLPLINIELYLASEQSTALAMGHGFFIIPMAGDMMAKIYGAESDDENTNTLKDLTILGNIVSLTFLAVNENNYLYGGMAITAFVTKYGSMLFDSYFEGCIDNCMLLGYSLFTFLASAAITGEPSNLFGK